MYVYDVHVSFIMVHALHGRAFFFSFYAVLFLSCVVHYRCQFA